MSERKTPSGRSAFALVEKRKGSGFNVVVYMDHVTEWGEQMEACGIIAEHPSRQSAQTHADRINEAMALTWRDL